MIVDLQRSMHETGRLRAGQQVQSGNHTRPASLDTWRVTSPDRSRVDQIAARYGGTPTQWDAPSGRQWEVVTEVDALPVIVPPGQLAFSQHYELWSAGGCQRRCDGATESLTDQRCLCDPDNRECSIHSRLSVMLRDVPGLGVWRLDTSGYYAARELQGAVQTIHTAAGTGALLPARLRLEQRSVKRQVDGKAQTRNFVVPVLDIEATPAQLLSGQGGAGMLDETTSTQQPAAIEAPSFTPVPVDESPTPSIAEQTQPPAPKPKRANAAPEIPSSGRNRRGDAEPEQLTETAPEPEQPTLDNNSDEALLTQKQSNLLKKRLRELGIDDHLERRTTVSTLTQRELSSSNELTQSEADRVNKLLGRLLKRDEPAKGLDAVLMELSAEQEWGPT